MGIIKKEKGVKLSRKRKKGEAIVIKEKTRGVQCPIVECDDLTLDYLGRITGKVYGKLYNLCLSLTLQEIKKENGEQIKIFDALIKSKMLEKEAQRKKEGKKFSRKRYKWYEDLTNEQRNEYRDLFRYRTVSQEERKILEDYDSRIKEEKKRIDDLNVDESTKKEMKKRILSKEEKSHYNKIKYIRFMRLYELQDHLVKLKGEGYDWLYEFWSGSISKTANTVTNTWNNFFWGLGEKPRYKNRYSKQSVCVCNPLSKKNIERIDDKKNKYRIKLPKIGYVTITCHRDVIVSPETKINNIFASYNRCKDKFFLSINYSVPIEKPIVIGEPKNVNWESMSNPVGIDRNANISYALSDGGIFVLKNERKKIEKDTRILKRNIQRQRNAYDERRKIFISYANECADEMYERLSERRVKDFKINGRTYTFSFSDLMFTARMRLTARGTVNSGQAKSYREISITDARELRFKNRPVFDKNCREEIERIIEKRDLTDDEIKKIAYSIMGSKKLEKNNLRLAKKQAKNANKRRDFNHKVTRAIADKYDLIGIEDLKIKNMTASASGSVEAPGKKIKQNSGRTKAFLASNPGQFKMYLEYKVNENGLPLIKVNPQGTSVTCCLCGCANDNTRKDDLFSCSSCGLTVHADFNASLEIQKRAMELAGIPSEKTNETIERRIEEFLTNSDNEYARFSFTRKYSAYKKELTEKF